MMWIVVFGIIIIVGVAIWAAAPLAGVLWFVVAVPVGVSMCTYPG